MNYIRLLVAFLSGLCLILFACEENARSPIPEAPVSLLLDLNYRDADLIPALASKSFTEPRLATDRLGFGGILVVAGLSSSGSTGNLFAYDLACPVEVDPKVKVVPDNVGKAVCPKCGAIFVTAYGNGMPETKSRHPLKSYAVRQISDKQYVVRN